MTAATFAHARDAGLHTADPDIPENIYRVLPAGYGGPPIDQDLLRFLHLNG